MVSFRKTLARQFWLLPALIFLLLVQMQQAIACGLMQGHRSKAGPSCNHVQDQQRTDQTQKSCCDFSITGTQCHIEQETVLASSPAGKLTPDYYPALITFNLPEIIPYPRSAALTYVPDHVTSCPGTQTYLITQRLRI